MRLTNSATTMALGALAVVVTWGAAPQSAEAGPACNELGLDSPCIRSNDLRARLNLDEDGTSARLRLRNEDGDDAIELDAGSANVTNLFSNEEDESNGLVKAWANMNADGTIAACWRCNTDPAETLRTATGVYEVDFTPLATDITGRPRSAVISGTGAFPQAVIRVADIDDDASGLNIATNTPGGGLVDVPFVLIIY
jgi:hypothetical protein